MVYRTVSCVLGAALAAAALVVVPERVNAEIPPYQLVGQFTMPGGGVGGGGLVGGFDVLPDGRVLFLHQSQFLAADVRVAAPAVAIGSVGPGVVSSFGATFVSVSPDGGTIAIGDNNFGSGASVHFVSAAALSTAGPTGTVSVACPNGEAAWAGGGGAGSSRLLVAGFGTGPILSSVDPVGLTRQTLLTGIGDGTGGVAVDSAGQVYVGLGFDAAGGTTTGQVRAFDLAALDAAASGGLPTVFASGTLVARALSGSFLGFDGGGNLLVGGGDFFSGSADFGSAAVIDGSSVAGALGGGPIAPIASQLRLSPAGTGAFYSIKFNRVTGELLVGDGATLYRYAVPAAGPTGIAVLGALAAARRSRRGRSGTAAACAGVLGALAAPAVADSPFAARVLAYRPAPGQLVNHPEFSDPSRALGAPMGGGVATPDNSKLVTLGGFGGSITLGFDHSVINRPATSDSVPPNPRGVDLIVFGNAFCVGGDPSRRWAEPATIEVSRDDNGNGLADDAWYLIRGSHSGATESSSTQLWDDDFEDATLGPASPAWAPAGESGVWQTAAFALSGSLFSAVVLANPFGSGAAVEGVWGYADCSPVLALGDLDADGIAESPGMLAEEFFTRPDDPLSTGVDAGSAGGDAIDISWAIDAATGAPAGLDAIDFVRVTSAVAWVSATFGERSAEIGGIAEVRVGGAFSPRDFNRDGEVNPDDLGDYINAYFAGDARADFNADGELNPDDLGDYINVYFAP